MTVNFINRDGEKITAKASPGESLLDVVVDQDLDFDGFGESIIFQLTSSSVYVSMNYLCVIKGPVQKYVNPHSLLIFQSEYHPQMCTHGNTTAHFYSQLLFIYLLENETLNVACAKLQHIICNVFQYGEFCK